MNTQVLIVGAGPTGLALALWLRRQGVSIRIIDKSDGPGETSRALAVQARTLEFHRQLGIVDDVLAAGLRIEQLSIRAPEQPVTALRLGAFGAGLSRYPFAFALPQDIHERVLLDHLARAGVQAERKTELVAFTQSSNSVVATIAKGEVTETAEFAYLCGCDGAHSAVRHRLQIGFPGGVYDESFYVADVQGAGEITDNGMDVHISPDGFAIVMPVRQTGSLRLIGVVPARHKRRERIDFADVRDEVERDTGIRVDAVNWFSTYRVHHRVAEKFRVGRVFLAGDAGHVHSPAGGQGMNTGVGDAVNLAWKLATVLQGRASPRLLESYETERIAFARLLIKSTDQAFKLITGRSALSRFWRQHVMPRFAGAIVANPLGARMFFKLVSQTAIHYRGGPISAGRAGKLRGGDRLPYLTFASGDNFAPLDSLDWQVHVYGMAKSSLRTALAASGVAVHEFPWSPAANRAGLARNAAYLLRPDGHIALATPHQDSAQIGRYLANLGVSAIDAAGLRLAA